MLKNSIEPVPILRKTLNHLSQINVQEKSRKQWNGGNLYGTGGMGLDRVSMPSWAEHRHLTTISSHLISSLSQYLWLYMKFQSIVICVESSASGDWSQSQCPFLSPEVQKVLTFKCFVDYFSQSCQYTGSISNNLSTCERQRFQNFQEYWTMNQDNIQIWTIKWYSNGTKKKAWRIV